MQKEKRELIKFGIRQNLTSRFETRLLEWTGRLHDSTAHSYCNVHSPTHR